MSDIILLHYEYKYTHRQPSPFLSLSRIVYPDWSSDHVSKRMENCRCLRLHRHGCPNHNQRGTIPYACYGARYGVSGGYVLYHLLVLSSQHLPFLHGRCVQSPHSESRETRCSRRTDQPARLPTLKTLHRRRARCPDFVRR